MKALTLLVSIFIGSHGQALSPPNTNDDVKVCFGDAHPRCFELQGSQYVQTFRGNVLGPIQVNGPERERLFLAIRDYKIWAQNVVAKHKTKTTSCTDTALFKTGAKEEKICLAGINQKLADAKTRELLKVLEAPKLAALKPASAQKSTPGVKGK